LLSHGEPQKPHSETSPRPWEDYERRRQRAGLHGQRGWGQQSPLVALTSDMRKRCRPAHRLHSQQDCPLQTSALCHAWLFLTPEAQCGRSSSQDTSKTLPAASRPRLVSQSPREPVHPLQSCPVRERIVWPSSARQRARLSSHQDPQCSGGVWSCETSAACCLGSGKGGAEPAQSKAAPGSTAKNRHGSKSTSAGRELAQEAPGTAAASPAASACLPPEGRTPGPPGEAKGRRPEKAAPSWESSGERWGSDGEGGTGLATEGTGSEERCCGARPARERLGSSRGC